MSGWDDLPYEMPIGTIDDDTTDRLLAGRIDPDDAPPGYAGVARILQAAGSLPRSEHLSREAELVTAAREVMGVNVSPGRVLSDNDVVAAIPCIARCRFNAHLRRSA